ncbi:lipocalin-like domain-containing protein [Myroides sp. LJL115]
MNRRNPLLIILILSLFMFSCIGTHKQSLQDQHMREQIIGTWDVVSIYKDGHYYDLDKCELEKGKFVFLQDNKMKEQKGELDDNDQCNIVEQEYNYEISGGHLYLYGVNDQTEVRMKYVHVDENTIYLGVQYSYEAGRTINQYKYGEEIIYTLEK